MLSASIHFQVSPHIKPSQSIAFYKEKDFSLIVGPSRESLKQIHRITIDTLTLLFSPEEHVFVGLDAYTNAERWARKHLQLPRIHQEKALICLEEFDKHGISTSRSVELDYTYSLDNELLRIKLAGGQAITYIRCLSCVVGGLTAQNELAELWIEQLNWI